MIDYKKEITVVYNRKGYGKIKKLLKDLKILTNNIKYTCFDEVNIARANLILTRIEELEEVLF